MSGLESTPWSEDPLADETWIRIEQNLFVVVPKTWRQAPPGGEPTVRVVVNRWHQTSGNLREVGALVLTPEQLGEALTALRALRRSN